MAQKFDSPKRLLILWPICCDESHHAVVDMQQLTVLNFNRRRVPAAPHHADESVTEVAIRERNTNIRVILKLKSKCVAVLPSVRCAGRPHAIHRNSTTLPHRRSPVSSLSKCHVGFRVLSLALRLHPQLELLASACRPLLISRPSNPLYENLPGEEEIARKGHVCMDFLLRPRVPKCAMSRSLNILFSLFPLPILTSPDWKSYHLFEPIVLVPWICTNCDFVNDKCVWFCWKP